ncbi:class IIb bacteriocin, lactobin A/cerein 7B family [Shewanella gaetbuli]|uniref:Class IIb bacteriocin, lactobin A/cerein 7B family n=1 Tax=Shewanella gaetbuli TaxID=220752 RepID=A0A9X2CI76_9GAMM|nr:class IIb bacteriocin, lactobin A/cerein 7B family [Shewanella gaetbuli]MCL1142742.1 class IIb bacteriocin, lactobin A/cerein 7B family [Shewanella gaetbuli]
MQNSKIEELTFDEIEQVNGGGALFALGYGGAVIAVAATTFKTAYETATFFGAGRLGSWLGRNAYDFFHPN